MKKIILVFLLQFAPQSFAQAFFQPGQFFLDPRVAVGFNPAQGTFFLGGLDLGYGLTENFAAGVHGYYAAGETPEHDREIAGGGFGVYAQQITSFLTGQLRQELNYVDQHDRITTYVNGQKRYSHAADTGVASVTYAGLHFRFTENLGLSGGYRLVLGLTNDDIGHKRSGTYLGVTIGI